MYSSFWSNFDKQTDSTANSTLNDVKSIMEMPEGFEIKDILCAPDFVQECSYPSPEFKKIFDNAEHRKKILTYLLVEPDISSDDDRKFKLPFKSNELVKSNCIEFLSLILKNSDEMELILDFLLSEKTNNVLAGYFFELIKALIRFDYSAVINAINDFGSDIVIERLIHHIGNKSIQLTLNILGWKETAKLSQNWLVEGKLVEKLLQKLLAGASPLDCISISEVCDSIIYECCFVHKNRHKTFKFELYNNMASKKSAEILMKVMKERKDDFSFECAIHIFYNIILKEKEIFENIKNDFSKENKIKNFDSSDDYYVSKEYFEDGQIHPTVKVILSNLEFLMDILRTEPNGDSDFNNCLINTSSAENSPSNGNEKKSLFKSKFLKISKNKAEYKPKRDKTVKNPLLGIRRKKVIILILCLLGLSTAEIWNAVSASDFFKILVNLFVEIKSNNNLHLYFCQIVRQTLTGESFALKKAIFAKGKLLQKLIEVGENNKIRLKEKGYSDGNMPFAVDIASFIDNLSKTDSTIKSLIKKENCAEWIDFCKFVSEKKEKYSSEKWNSFEESAKDIGASIIYDRSFSGNYVNFDDYD